LLGQIILQVVLIALNAIFACAEIAVISMNDNKIAKMAAAGDKKAVRLAKLTSQPARFLATIQVAITLSGFLGSAFAAQNFSESLVAWLIGLGLKIPAATLNAIAVVLITIVLSYFTLVLGELVPKRVAMKRAEKLALGMSALIMFISKAFAPIVWLLTASTNVMLRLFGIDPNAEDETVTEEEIRMMVDVGSEKGTIDADEKMMIQNIFEFDNITAGEISTHRTDTYVLWMDETPEQWEDTINESRHSRYPVCSETIDDVVGVLTTKEYFRIKDKTIENIVTAAVKPAYFVLESVRADVLFQNMQKNRNHFAVILDEYGGVTGIVTMNDLLEQLVGELEDEAAAPGEAPDIEQTGENTWEAIGTVLLDELSEAIAISIESEEYDTLSGLIIGTHGAVPDDGDQIEVEVCGMKIKTLLIEDHRVERAEITLPEKEEPEE